jgi:hypothetical protein
MIGWSIVQRVCRGNVSNGEIADRPLLGSAIVPSNGGKWGESRRSALRRRDANSGRSSRETGNVRYRAILASSGQSATAPMAVVWGGQE